MSGKGVKRPTYGQRVPRLLSTGYVAVYAPDHPLAMSDGYVLEHRKVVHDAGIKIPPGHLVHHKDEDKTNNALDNLEVISRRDHQRHHLGRYATPQEKWHADYLRRKARA